MDQKIKVLITDAGYKHTLAAVRSLGKAGFFVIVMGSNRFSQSFFSRYCNKKLICPDPRNEEEFIQFLIEYLSKESIDVLMPIGYTTTVTISKHKKELLSYVKIPIANYESMQIASNKEKTMQLADSLNIPTPIEYYSIDNVEIFPVVVKGLYESGHVRYINSPDELSTINFNKYLIQEYIPGEGYGFYALFNNGIEKAGFMHKRLREYPISGGASTCAKSVYDEELKRLGLALLRQLHWHGVAMVEFKKDSRDGKFKLMEINPKFWGSLDLSIAAGIDFPVLLVNMALEGDITPIFQYDTDMKYRWPFPDDTLHILANPKSIMNVIMESFNKKLRSNVSIGDFLPNILQIFSTCIAIKTWIRQGNFRYPYGKPKVKK